MRQPPDELPPTADAETAEGERNRDQPIVRTFDQLVLDGRLQGPVNLGDSELIMGMERKLLEQFLTLIRDSYEKVDKATFFLEVRTGNINVSGVRNLRGILSHLAMFLDPNAPPGKREEQLISAEGHLRRAITEPYEMALDSLSVAFALVYERYKKEVLPVCKQHVSLTNAPNSVMVEARLREIEQLAMRGREGKDKALRDPEWESEVSCFVEAFEKLATLKLEIEGYCNTYDLMQEQEAREEVLQAQLREEIGLELDKEMKHAARVHFLGISIGILGIVVAVLLVLLPKFGVWIRSLLGL